MIKRFAIVPVTTNPRGGPGPTIPAEALGCIPLHYWPNFVLVKLTLPDGTPTAAGWLADITIDTDGNQVDVTATTLSAVQRTVLTTFLTARGFDSSSIDVGITNRKLLLSKILRFIANRADLDSNEVLFNGYDAG